MHLLDLRLALIHAQAQQAQQAQQPGSSGSAGNNGGSSRGSPLPPALVEGLLGPLLRVSAYSKCLPPCFHVVRGNELPTALRGPWINAHWGQWALAVLVPLLWGAPAAGPGVGAGAGTAEQASALCRLLSTQVSSEPWALWAARAARHGCKKWLCLQANQGRQPQCPPSPRQAAGEAPYD